MRRYTFYLSIALLAFGIGLLVAFKFYIRPAEQIVGCMSIETSESDNKQQTQIFTEELPSDEDFDYEDKAAFRVFEPTIRKWLNGQKIKTERVNITSELIKEVTGKNEAELSDTELSFWKDLGFEFTPYLIDADGDGQNELAIENRCAPVGNCELQLFKKNQNSYEIIFKSSPRDLQRFKLRKSKKNGHFDLETTTHGDSSSGQMDIYKFNGKEYILDACFDYNYIYTSNKGKRIELKKPRLTPLHCC